MAHNIEMGHFVDALGMDQRVVHVVSQAVPAQLPRVPFKCDPSRGLGVTSGKRIVLDLSRICAAPGARLSHLSFKSDRAFPAQC